MKKQGVYPPRMAGDENVGALSADPRWRGRSWRIAGEDFGRILALSDGVFAFAMTLLAITLAVPVVATSGRTEPQISQALGRALVGDIGPIFGYAFAFVMIGVWWIVHNRSFQYLARYDSALVWINMSILIQIAIMPFVMGVYNSYNNVQAAVDLFAGLQVTLGLTNMLLWEYAHRRGLLRNDVPEDVARYFTRRGWFSSAVFAVSIGISFVSVTGAQLTWIATFFALRFSLPKQVEEEIVNSPEPNREP